MNNSVLKLNFTSDEKDPIKIGAQINFFFFLELPAPLKGLTHIFYKF